MTYESMLKPFVGALCKFLPIQSIGMWELVIPVDEGEHNARLLAVGKDCVHVLRDESGPLQGLSELIPYARLATFIPRSAGPVLKRNRAKRRARS